MIQRKELKSKARKTIRKNYWAVTFVCFLILISGGIYNDSKLNIEVNYGYIDNNNVYMESNYDITNQILKDVFKTDNIDEIYAFENVTGGTFRFIFNILTKFERALFKTLKSILNIIHPSKLGFVVILCVYLFRLLYKTLLANPLQVGESRFFLETRAYPKTKFTRLFYSFHKGNYIRSIKAIFRKNVYLLLWSLTIIGVVIKTYSYRLVNYIVASNPNISSKEAIDLSRKMMYGHKWEAFKLDLSFIGWELLNICTFGLVGLFYSVPYKKATNSEFFIAIKDMYDKEHEIFQDKDLFTNEKNLNAYPGTEERKKIDASKKFNYYKRYSFTSMILFFFSFSMLGWLWEVIIHFIQYGDWVNRGVLLGPWLPIYGSGCVIVLLLLIPKNFKKITDNPALTFLLIMIICTIIEYLTSVYLEVTKGSRWWDYTGFLFNINGRVCLEGSLFFGLGGTACIYLIAPALDKLFTLIPKKTRNMLCILLVVAFSLDFVYSHFHPNTEPGAVVYQEVEETIII